MTALAQKVFDSLPPRVVKQIERLAKKLDESPEQVIERAVDLLAQTHRQASSLNDPLSDPIARKNFSRIMSAMGKKSTAGFTAAELTARGQAGAASRSANLTPEARKKIASAAAKKRWAKKAADEQES